MMFQKVGKSESQESPEECRLKFNHSFRLSDFPDFQTIEFFA
jgi:hypothetical protein